MKGWPHHRGLCPLLFSYSGVGSLTSHKEPDKWKCCERERTVFRPYPWGLESLTVCRCHNKGNTFFLSYFKTVNVGPAWVWNLRPPAHQIGALTAELTRGRSVETSSFWKISLGCIFKSVFYICIKLMHTVRYINVIPLTMITWLHVLG